MNFDGLSGLDAVIAGADREDLPAIIGEFARLEALARLRLSQNAGRPERENGAGRLSRYLTASKVAARLGVSEKWVYANQDELGAVKLGRCVRFPEAAMARYMRRHGTA